MPDRISREKRSWNMSQIKGKDTSIEVMVRKYLFKHGFRYRKNVSALPGKPDILLPKYKTVIFVNGCFWHGHDCRNTKPSQNAEFWNKKRDKNKRHDEEVTKLFMDRGWKVLRIWECELRKKNQLVLSAKLHQEIR